ncbi:MAG: hypothetical protein IPM50_05290 [Acidobacteriota bacterium]|nr:MAG: hypothetical protein IPM50_05290 [Acidobacteriota bacterium]
MQVILEQGQHPEIRVLEPQLTLAPGAKRLPHIYPGKSLCLYTRSKQEWDSSKYVADTVIPWISSYLFYYELWLATGKWFGDGTEPE